MQFSLFSVYFSQMLHFKSFLCFLLSKFTRTTLFHTYYKAFANKEEQQLSRRSISELHSYPAFLASTLSFYLDTQSRSGSQSLLLIQFNLSTLLVPFMQQRPTCSTDHHSKIKGTVIYSGY